MFVVWAFLYYWCESAMGGFVSVEHVLQHLVPATLRHLGVFAPSAPEQKPSSYG